MPTFKGINPKFGNVEQNEFSFPIPQEGEVFRIDNQNYGVFQGGKVYEFAPESRLLAGDQYAGGKGVIDPNQFSFGDLQSYNRADLKTALDAGSQVSGFAPANLDIINQALSGGLKGGQDIYDTPNVEGTDRVRSNVAPEPGTVFSSGPTTPVGQVKVAGTGENTMPLNAPTSMPASTGVRILNEQDLQTKREELTRAGVKPQDFGKFISAPDGQGRLYFSQPATLTGPNGEKKVVATGSTEASQLLRSGWTLGAGKALAPTSVVTSEDLQDQENIKLDGVTDNVYPTSSVQETVARAAATSQSIDEYLNMIRMPETVKSTQADELTQRINELIGETAGQQQTLAQEEERLGVRKLEEGLKNINNEINIKTAALQQRLAGLEVLPQTMSRLQGAQAAATRVAQADIMFLQAQAQAMMNNISFAKETAQDAVNAKYNPILEELNIKVQQLDILQPALEKEESEYATALKLALQDRQSQIADKKDEEAKINQIAMEVIVNNPAIGKDRIVEQIKGAGSVIEALQIAGQLATGSGYQYVSTPAELTKLKNAGYEIVNLGGRMYARQPEVVAVSGGGGGGGGGSNIPTPQSTVSVPTFDEFIQQKSNEIGQSIAFPEDYQDEYNALVASAEIQDRENKLASLQPFTRDVLENPKLWFNLTATEKGDIGREIANAGIDTGALLEGKKEKLSATQADSLVQAQLAKSNIERIQQLFNEIGDTGPAVGRFRSANPYDDKVVELNNLITQTVPGLARGIFKEVGVLTDQDVARYRSTIANPNLTASQAKTATENLLNTINSSLSIQLDTYNRLGYDIDNFSDLGQTRSDNQSTTNQSTVDLGDLDFEF